MPPSVTLAGPVSSYFKDFILTPDALNFIVHLHSRFNSQRKDLLHARSVQQKEWDRGVKPGFLESTRDIRTSSWQVVEAPHDLRDRRVEITGPVEQKMMINAMNSGAKVFMADLEDACSPTWQNILKGHDNLNKTVRRAIDFTTDDGKSYKLNDTVATLMVRPRGWHLLEANVLVDKEPVSASLFDFGLFLFHNAAELIKRGSGPYFYLPKMEHHLEARLWNSVFQEAERYLGLRTPTIRSTALIETITAAFQMEEILWELRTYMTGLNAGRWDYIFSLIKKFGKSPDHILPDRQHVTMAVPFMRAYAQLLVQTCHKRGAHAIGGMAAFIPNRKDAALNERALTAVRTDKEREAKDGFDGTWVAHPDLVGVAQTVFDSVLGKGFHQKDVLRQDVQISAESLLQTTIPNSSITELGLRNNISVTLQYMNKWLAGYGAVAINNLMEDTATAEISRTQIWQWLRHRCQTLEGRKISPELYQTVKDDELKRLIQADGLQKFAEAGKLIDELVLAEECPEFLTVSAYRYLQ